MTQTSIISKLHQSNSGTRVILVRHGRSTYNEQGRYQGSSDDSVLTEQGLRSAYQTGLTLKGVKIDAIYTSPLQRTQQTAHQILKVIGIGTDSLIPLHINNKLKEISMSHWEGLPFSYVREQFADEYRLWKERPHQFAIASPRFKYPAVRGNLAVAAPASEQYFPVLELYDRVKQFWQEVLPRHAGQTILIVSHGGTIRALIGTAIGIKPNRFHSLQQSNCGINLLNFPLSHTQPAQLELLNCTTHLREVLPKLKEGKKGLRLLLVPDGTSNHQTEKLAQSLSLESIDFSISSESPNCIETASQIVQYHPATVALQVSRADFPLAWYQAIYARSGGGNKNHNSEGLITGLVVAQKDTLKNFLAQLLNSTTVDSQNISLDSPSISVIHYPSADHPPILQALNIEGRASTQSDRC
ncbi:MAG: histidine phosphatase family protein [Xenococcus sp. MO_188.B8]|nr:histidine phosphatase family protein [Xenococcus sp. MO_188.B8]